MTENIRNHFSQGVLCRSWYETRSSAVTERPRDASCHWILL